MQIYEKIKEELEKLPSDYILYLETSPEKAFEVSTAILKYYSKKNDKGIIISANRPYTNLMSVFKKNNIESSKMIILDGLSKSQHADEPANNVVFIENLSALTDMSLAVDEHINHTTDSKFLFIDSLTTMLIHNKPVVLSRFIHNILTKMRLKGVGGVIISLKEKSNTDVRADIAQLCDKVLKI
jgi:hypothetical protein